MQSMDVDLAAETELAQGKGNRNGIVIRNATNVILAILLAILAVTLGILGYESVRAINICHFHKDFIDSPTVMFTYGGPSKTMGEAGSFDPKEWLSQKSLERAVISGADGYFEDEGVQAKSKKKRAAIVKTFPVPKFKDGVEGVPLKMIAEIDAGELSKAISDLMKAGPSPFQSRSFQYYLFGRFGFKRSEGAGPEKSLTKRSSAAILKAIQAASSKIKIEVAKPMPTFEDGGEGTALDMIAGLDATMSGEHRAGVMSTFMEPGDTPGYAKRDSQYYIYGPFKSSIGLLEALKADPMLNPVYEKWSKFDGDVLDVAFSYGSALYLKIKWQGWFESPVVDMDKKQFGNLVAAASKRMGSLVET